MAIRVGVAWYQRDQWELLRQVAADPEVIEETYDEWVAVAERTLRMAAEEGQQVEKVPVDVREIMAWCTEENRPVDGAARAAFSARLLRKKDQAE